MHSGPDTQSFSLRSIAIVLWLVFIGLAALTGCALKPEGTKQEMARVDAAGMPYTRPYEQRHIPELPLRPDWRDVLQRAFYANGDLETAYHEWKAAAQRIEVASAYPNTNVQLGFDYMFSKESMKAWDRTTISVGFDPAMMLQWPEKVRKAGRSPWKRRGPAAIVLRR